MMEAIITLFIYSVFGVSIAGSSQVSIAICPSGRKPIITTETVSIPETYISTASGDGVVRQSLEFVLNSKLPFNCANDSILTTMEIDVNSVVFTQLGHFGRYGVINGSKVIYWLDPDKFCGSWESKKMEAEGFSIGFCQSLGEMKPTVLFKCCTPGYIMDFRTRKQLTCQPSINSSWSPMWYEPESFLQGTCARESKGHIEFQIVTKLEGFHQSGIFLINHPYSQPYLNITESGIWWYLVKGGRLRSRKRKTGGTSGSKLYKQYENSKFVGPNFCVDGLVNSHHNPEFRHRISEIAIIELKSNTPVIRITDNITVDQQRKNWEEERSIGKQLTFRTKTILHVSAFYISSLFLVVALFKSVLVINKSNVSGLTIITYTVSIFLANFFSGLSNTMNFVLDLQQRRGFWCTSIAMLTHFFILASAYWLLPVAWELRRALRCNNPDALHSESRYRYKFYFCGIFGSLIFIVGWLLYRDINYGAFAWFFSPCPVLVPGYGVDWCFLSYESQRKLLYLPLLILHTMGLVLYLVTIRQLQNSQASHYRNVEYIMIHSRSDPSLGLELKLLLVEFFSCFIDYLSSYWKPNVRTPEDASWWVVGLSVTVSVCRAILLFSVVNAEDPEPSYEEFHRVRWFATKVNASSSPISDPDDVSLNINVARESQVAPPPGLTFRNLIVEAVPSAQHPPLHPSYPGDAYLETEVLSKVTISAQAVDSHIIGPNVYLM